MDLSIYKTLAGQSDQQRGGVHDANQLAEATVYQTATGTTVPVESEVGTQHLSETAGSGLWRTGNLHVLILDLPHVPGHGRIIPQAA